MPRQQGAAHTNALMVVEGFQGISVAASCTEHPSRPLLDSPWRDPGLAHAAHAFAVPQHRQREGRLEQGARDAATARRRTPLSMQQKRRAVRRTRRRSRRVTPRAHAGRPRLQALKAGPSCWGDHRIWAHCRVVTPVPQHRQRLGHLRREPPLLVSPQLRLQAQCTPRPSPPRRLTPHAWWGLDPARGPGAKLRRGRHGGPARLVDATAGWTLGGSPRPRHALAGHPDYGRPPSGSSGGAGAGLVLDAGAWGAPPRAYCDGGVLHAGLQQACISANHPKGNTAMERGMRTLTEEGWWRQQGPCPVMRSQAREDGIADDNAPARPSALGYKPSAEVARDDSRSHGPPFLAA